MTEAALKKTIKDRCKQCNLEKDLDLCKNCKLNNPKNINLSILKYCKECLNGNTLEYCGCEDSCPLYKVVPILKSEFAEKLKKK